MREALNPEDLAEFAVEGAEADFAGAPYLFLSSMLLTHLVQASHAN